MHQGIHLQKHQGIQELLREQGWLLQLQVHQGIHLQKHQGIQELLREQGWLLQLQVHQGIHLQKHQGIQELLREQGRLLQLQVPEMRLLHLQQALSLIVFPLVLWSSGPRWKPSLHLQWSAPCHPEGS